MPANSVDAYTKYRWRDRLRYTFWVLICMGGTRKATCVACGYTGKFHAFGMPPRFNSLCPKCHTVERHRQLKLWFDAHPEIFTGKRILHFAPEPPIARFVRPVASSYLTADLMRDDVDLNLNIEAIDLPDASQDVIFASHILEHVDDVKALAELFRVVVPGGIVLIMVPIIEGWDRTYENPAATTYKERYEHFGQLDHVRYYGHDLRDRVTAAGFELVEYTAEEPDVMTYNLVRGEKIFVATRPLVDRTE